MNGEYDNAYNRIMNHNFHPWEGGEGKIPAQYRIALINKAKAEKNTEKAIEYLEKAAGQKNPYAAYLAGKIRLTEDSVKDIRKAIHNLKSPLRTEITMQSICSARCISTAKMPRVTMIERLYTLLPQPNMEISMPHNYSTA